MRSIDDRSLLISTIVVFWSS